MSLKKARIIAMGRYLPERILSNEDLEKMIDTNDEWILSRVGIKERRIAEKGELSSHMGAKAAKNAFEKSSVSIDQIDIILLATSTPDMPMPSTGAFIQKELGVKVIPCIDFSAACSGFIYGLSMAKAFIESGLYKNILLITSEKMSSIINFKDRSTCVLFGDGAAAAVISGEGEGFQIDHVSLGLDGEQSDLLTISCGGSKQPITHEILDHDEQYVKMSGREVSKNAVKRMEVASRECLESLNLTKNDIEWLIPHQANERIIDAVAKKVEIPKEKVVKNIYYYGNTSAASVPIALSELIEKQKIDEGKHLLLVAFGAGLTWGASILTKVLK